MKRIGVLGGMSAQATMDFELRVHRCAQQLIAQDWNRGYPQMVVWYHRDLPLRHGADGRRLEPRQIDPLLLEIASRLGAASDFLVVPCNAAHVGLEELENAAGRPVLSMITVVIDEVVRRRCRRIGLLGAFGVPAPYVEGFDQRAIEVERIDATLQAGVDDGIQAVMEGRNTKEHTRAALAAVDDLRERSVDAIVLGCTEIPLMLGDDGEAPDLINPLALLAEAAVRASLS